MSETRSVTIETGALTTSLQVLFRHRRLAVTTALAVLGMVAIFTILMKKQYRSEMKYLVQSARSTPVISSDRPSSSVAPIVTEEQLNSELAILQSEDVLSSVADPAWTPADARTKSKKELKNHERKVTTFSNHLTADPIGKEDVMTVSFTSDTAQGAADSLAALSEAYLAQHNLLQRPRGVSSFFDEQTNQYEVDWKSAVKRLVAFQQAHQVVAIPDLEESLERSIAGNEEILRGTDIKLMQSGASIASASALLAQVSPRQQTQERHVPSEILIQQLKTSLVGLANRRTELLNRYASTDRLVVEVDQEIADTTRALNAEKGGTSIENTSDVNPAWQQLKTSLLQEQVNHQGLRRGRAGMESQLAELRTRLDTTQALTLEFDELRSAAEQAQGNYKSFVEKRDLARVDDAMDQNKLVNVVVMQSPTLPYSPVRPKPLLNLLLGIPTALFVSLAAVYFAETGRPSIAGPNELDTFSEYPVLATIPLVSEFGDLRAT